MGYSLFTKDGTAQGVAKQRLIESLASSERRVINDPYAERFVLGGRISKLMGHRVGVWLTQRLALGFHEHLISRTRFIDDLIEEHVAQGVEQYVILGAGYDTRAHRLALPNTVKVFEVDQAEVQQRKREKLPQDIPNADNVTYVSVDFNHQTISEQLLARGFEQGRSTIFTLEGVSQYIPKSALEFTLKSLAALSQKASATFFISYVDARLRGEPLTCFGRGYPNAAKRAALVLSLSARVGEPWISLYTARELEEVLSQHGFSVVETKTLADLNEEYFTPVGRALSEDQIFNLERFVVAKT